MGVLVRESATLRVLFERGLESCPKSYSGVDCKLCFLELN